MVFENELMKRIFGPVKKSGRRRMNKNNIMRNFIICTAYKNTSIIKVLKSCNMRWAGRVARIERDEK
jgi:hypothetical protein